MPPRARRERGFADLLVNCLGDGRVSGDQLTTAIPGPDERRDLASDEHSEEDCGDTDDRPSLSVSPMPPLESDAERHESLNQSLSGGGFLPDPFHDLASDSYDLLHRNAPQGRAPALRHRSADADPAWAEPWQEPYVRARR